MIVSRLIIKGSIFRCIIHNMKYTIICMLTFSSCDSITGVEIPEKPEVLVVSGFFNPDSAFSVRITRSRHISDSRIFLDDRAIENATVSLFQGDDLVDIVPFVDNSAASGLTRSDRGRYRSDFIPAAGVVYTLQVEALRFEPVSTTSAIPSAVPILSLFVDENILEIDKHSSAARMRITFEDPPGEDFYLLQAFTRIEDEETFDLSPHSVMFRLVEEGDIVDEVIDGEPAYSDFGKLSIYFDDRAFDGTIAEQEFFVGQGLRSVLACNENVTSYIVLKHITREHFEFGTRFQIQEKIEGDPFAEPVQLPSNISGGLGLFAGFNQDSVTVTTKVFCQEMLLCNCN